MDEVTLYERILGISDPWFVEHVELNADAVHVYLGYDSGMALHCPICHQEARRYDAKPRTWRHMDTCQYQTLVHCDIPRTDCPEHGARQIEVPWAQRNGRFTHLFENTIIDWLQELSINAVARRFNLSWNAVDRFMRDAVARGLARRTSPDITHLSVDEVSQKKGQHYVTVISNRQGQVVGVQRRRPAGNCLGGGAPRYQSRPRPLAGPASARCGRSLLEAAVSLPTLVEEAVPVYPSFNHSENRWAAVPSTV